MDILSPITSIMNSQLKMPESIKNWQVEQVFEVSVVRKLDGGEYELDLNGQRFLAQSDKLLRLGQKLNVRVEGSKLNPALAVIDAESGPDIPETITRLINSLLPKQNAVTPLLNNLLKLHEKEELITQDAKPNGREKVQANIGRLLETTDKLLKLMPQAKEFLSDDLNKAVIKIRDLVKSVAAPLEAQIKASQIKAGVPAEISASIKDAANQDLKSNLEKISSELKALAETVKAESKERAPHKNHTSFQGKLLAIIKADINNAIRALKTELPERLMPIIKNDLDRPLNLTQVEKPPLPPMPGYAIKPHKGEGKSIEGFIGAKAILAELSNQTEAAIARTTIAKTTTASTESSPQIFIDIPVVRGNTTDLFQLRIEYEKESAKNDKGKHKQQRWHLELAFDIPPLGAVTSKINLSTSSINTSIWAQQPQTARWINQFVPLLEARLKGLGLEVEQISCYCGKVPVSNGDGREKGFYEKA